MVSKAAKDLLRNTIRNTDYHNRLLEEEDMWRHWETEKGLTMMVTDDYLRRRMRMDEYAKPSQSGVRSGKSGNDGPQKNKVDVRELQKQKQAARVSQKGQSNFWMRKLMETEEKDPDRWGHSGYKELYPDEFKSSNSRRDRSASSSASEGLRSRRPEYKTTRSGGSNKPAVQERWDHGGYRELYPDEFKSRRRQSSNNRRRTSDSRSLKSESGRSRSERSRSPKVKTKKKHKHRSHKKSKKHKKRKRKSVPVITISDSSNSRSSQSTDSDQSQRRSRSPEDSDFSRERSPSPYDSDHRLQRSRSSDDSGTRNRRRSRSPNERRRDHPSNGSRQVRHTTNHQQTDRQRHRDDSDSRDSSLTPSDRRGSSSPTSSRSTDSSADAVPSARSSPVSATSSSCSLITPTSSSLGSEVSYNSTGHSSSNWVESDTSETQLETQREYLKRKLEEVADESEEEEEEVVQDRDSRNGSDRANRKSGEPNRRVVIRESNLKRRMKLAPPVPVARRRLESQVVRSNVVVASQRRLTRPTKR